MRNGWRENFFNQDLFNGCYITIPAWYGMDYLRNALYGHSIRAETIGENHQREEAET